MLSPNISGGWDYTDSKINPFSKQESRISSFKPPTASLGQQLKNFLGIDKNFEFCSCDDENEQFRKEFQNKCMVVNQDLGPGVGEKKVQCILVSKEASKCSEHLKELEDTTEDAKLKQLTMVSPGINGRTPRVSTRLRLCERWESSPHGCCWCSMLKVRGGGHNDDCLPAVQQGANCKHKSLILHVSGSNKI